MLENTWYSVISPESCSSILWRSWDFKEKAANALKPTPQDLLKLGIIDSIVPEPVGGAHAAPEQAAKLLKAVISATLAELSDLTPQQRIDQRIERYSAIGTYHTIPA
jgi:acetyl-CoA carboxylase carboxyl transferase subunit alpha